MSPRRQCRSRTRTYFSLVGELSPGPPLLACLGFTNVASPSAFWILCVFPCFASRACPVKAIGLPFHLRDGDDGIRTHDPLLAGQVLSQLSYTPVMGPLPCAGSCGPSKLNNKSGLFRSRRFPWVFFSVKTSSAPLGAPLALFQASLFSIERR